MGERVEQDITDGKTAAAWTPKLRTVARKTAEERKTF